MAILPKPEPPSDHQTPTNVMVTFPSGMVRQGLGDCQAVGIMGRSGWREAGISLRVIRFIYKECTGVIPQWTRGEYPSSSPIAHKSKSIFPAWNVLKRICTPMAMLTFIFLFPGSLGCTGNLTPAFLTRPTEILQAAVRQVLFQQHHGIKGLF